MSNCNKCQDLNVDRLVHACESAAAIKGETGARTGTGTSRTVIPDSSVRSPALNGRYRAPAPSALTKLFAFVQIAALRDLLALPIETSPGAGLSFRERQTRTDLGPPALRVLSPIPGVARPPSIIPHSILRIPFASLPWTKIPLLPGGRVWPQNSHHVRIHTTGPTKALSEIGYEAPQDVVKKLIARVTPVSSRASSRATSPMKTNKNKNKRQASSSSDEGAMCSDSTVVGSDSESENSNTSFTLVEGKNKRALRKALKKAKVARDQPEMDIDPSSAPTSRANDAKPPRRGPTDLDYEYRPVESTRNPVSASTQAVTAKTAPRTGAKPTAPPPNIRRLHPSADKLHPFHTYALEEERKLKAVIRGIPTDFPVDEIQADLCGQGFPVHSVHRLCRRDGSPLWLVLAVLPRTEEAKNIFNNLNMVCGLGYPSRGPAQERRSRAVPPLPVVRPRGRQLSCGPALREMFGPTLDQRVPAYS
ncbi:hypothetical protein EVAR_21314_1 [Eumeta japonica]|uniref:Pre-C2HC domain-containing protein n=1 Tax=Eumeta variegata TaxID=151549 RepID=A0A4C1ZRF6_EUMVA|nr:hypothetical protein EVAR_21314_1 [Eumeta japonica]